MKLLITIICFFAVMLTYSCERNASATTCYTCEKRVAVYVDGRKLSSNTSKQNICDLNTLEIQQYEQMNTYTTSRILNGGPTEKTVTTTSCRKQ